MLRSRFLTAAVVTIVQLALSAVPSDAQNPRVRRSPGRRIGAGTFLTEIAKLMPGDANSSYLFGSSLGMSGDTLVVVSIGDETEGLYSAGSAYVYFRSEGEWTFHQKVTASEPERQDYFRSPTILGDTLFIGAYGNDADGYGGAGAVYVFTRPPGDDTYWTQHQKLTASNLDFSDQFGVSTAGDGNTLVVGARGVGTAYVFNRNDNGDWEEQQILTLTNGPEAASAECVTIDGDTIMVGFPQLAHSGFSSAGGVDVFTRSGSVWSRRQLLTATDPADGDFFGIFVKVVGDTAVIGAPADTLENYGDEDPRDFPAAGSLHVFTRTGGTWVHQQTINASNPIDHERFGTSATLADGVLLVGAASYADEGAVYLFTRSGEEWVQRQRITASDASQWDTFGQSLCVDDHTVVVAAPDSDHSGLTDAGAVYLYRLRTLPRFLDAGAMVSER